MTAETLLEAMVLKSSRRSWVIVALIGLPFIALSIFASEGWINPLARWLVGGFFGLLTLIALPGALGWRSQLEFDRAGFTCVTLFSSWRRTWAECTEFATIVVGSSKFVSFTNATDERKQALMAFASRMMTGSTGMLPDTYGRTAGELAGLMNRYRLRAIGR